MSIIAARDRGYRLDPQISTGAKATAAMGRGRKRFSFHREPSGQKRGQWSDGADLPQTVRSSAHEHPGAWAPKSMHSRPSIWKLFLCRSLALSAFGIWVFGATDVQQFVAAVTAGVLAAAGLSWLRAAAGIHFDLPAGGLSVLLRRLPLNVLRDLTTLFLALGPAMAGRHRPVGACHELAFDAGENSASAAARRALVLAAASTSPNTIALEVDRRKHLLHVHRLIHAKTPADRKWPI